MEGRMKFPQVRRWSGKRRMGSYNRKWPNQKKKKKEKGEETQKSLLIRFPGYDDQECHPSWIYRFRNGFQRRKEGRMIQRIACTKMKGSQWKVCFNKSEYIFLKRNTPWKNNLFQVNITACNKFLKGECRKFEGYFTKAAMTLYYII